MENINLEELEQYFLENASKIKNLGNRKPINAKIYLLNENEMKEFVENLEKYVQIVNAKCIEDSKLWREKFLISINIIKVLNNYTDMTSNRYDTKKIVEKCLEILTKDIDVEKQLELLGLPKFVYRALSNNNIQNIENGITCEDKDSTVGLRTYLARGSNSNRPKSRFISTTTSSGIASVKYGRGIQRKNKAPIIIVNLEKFLSDKNNPTNILRIYTSELLYKSQKSHESNSLNIETINSERLEPEVVGKDKNFMEADSEVIIEQEIPSGVFQMIPPTIVDILYAVELCGWLSELDSIYEIINIQKEDEYIKSLLRDQELKNIEKDFFRLYYGICLDDSKNISESEKDCFQSLEKTGEELAKIYNIENRDLNVTELATCIHAEIVKKISILALSKNGNKKQTGKLKPNRIIEIINDNYLEPIDEMAATASKKQENNKIKKGRFSITMKKGTTLRVPSSFSIDNSRITLMYTEFEQISGNMPKKSHFLCKKTYQYGSNIFEKLTKNALENGEQPENVAEAENIFNEKKLPPNGKRVPPDENEISDDANEASNDEVDINK